ncbi:glycoside hydrolase family 15 protein [Pseudomonas sp. CFBP 13727]|uniref:glycoside hydrolase family 15 protein n=1 Tax=Pseudomonas sp. CFBP 13727 TaxID=2775295 RepID=UPI0017858CF3|nr:glycoside hydrolase family 15 protein [Pseudomonas sp. CFBP 13727]MBD8624795.1 glycoside hydrolase family 15 protein [Pseudomonas sp. CFBP 13727]
MPALIEDYALLGNCRTAALVDKSGSLDWLCFPRFDSPACFSALLGDSENGRWRICPSDALTATERRYRDSTMILETVFHTENGSAMLVDWMPVGDQDCVVRTVVGLSGKVAFDMELVMRFDYGSSVPWVEQAHPRTLTAVAGPDMLVLRSASDLHAVDHRTGSRFTVAAGERLCYRLSFQASHLPLQPAVDADRCLAETERYWHEFAERCPDVGAWTPLVKRSLLTLKAMTYVPTGGIVAAVTTSLPEQLGGERNWDYRYCWLRDATMTLLAFMNLGYYEEAAAWRKWLMRSVAGNPEQMQIMYGLAGERRLPEQTLPWLAGYEGSAPVRIGNGAATQRQLDVYGEVADAMSQAIRAGLPRHPRGAAIFRVILPYLESIWEQPDEGIWEIRGAPQHFTHSKVMAWVAFDRAANLAEPTEEGREQAARYRAVADRIHAQVCSRGIDAQLGHFVQAYGSTHTDASLLQIALTGFLPPDDPRVVATVARIESTLIRDGLLLRYDTAHGVDGLNPGEGTFLVCSFWLADVYVLQGRMADAERLFERLAGLCNDVGLLAEQYDPQAGRMLGNFPQAFSQLGIINTALNLYRAQNPAQARAAAAVGARVE